LLGLLNDGRVNAALSKRARDRQAWRSGTYDDDAGAAMAGHDATGD
jgi:hypothetical protein